MLQADAEKLDKKIEDRPQFGVYADKRNRKLKKMVLDMKCSLASCSVFACCLPSNGSLID